jgi:Uma2 family endonuclease
LGSFTQEKGEEVSAQADESFLIGKSTGITPDLSIEVVFTSGGKRKLTRYQALGVPAVWFWEDGVFGLYHINSASIVGRKIESTVNTQLSFSFSTPPSTVNSQQSTIIPVQPELISFAIARL